MSGFDASSAVETLDYDFTKAPRAIQPPLPTGPTEVDEFAGHRPIMCSGKGVIPEPTGARIERLHAFIRDGQNAALAALRKLKQEGQVSAPESYQEASDKLIAALVDVCGGSPTEAELRELPPRVLGAFYRWIAGELSPKD